MRRLSHCIVCTSAAVLLGGAPTLAQQQPQRFDYYDYGGAGYSGDSGVLLTLEAWLANPRNVDNVIATDTAGSTVKQIIPAWDDELAGRIGLGYQWGNGNRLLGQAWGFSSETSGSGSGAIAFAIGPPIAPGVGDLGTGYDITTEIKASTLDALFGRRQQLGDTFAVEWSVGLRYAYFEETYSGFYASGASLYGALKSNEAEMLGARAGLRGSYEWKSFVVQVGTAYSALGGEITASSSLISQGTGPTSLAELVDDSRSGDIFELDVLFGWRTWNRKMTLAGGWEQQVWNDIATDLVRNLPGMAAPLRNRDSVTFSALKLGLYFVF